MTNGDYIRKLSDDELACFIANFECEAIKGNVRIFPNDYSFDEIAISRANTLYDWLQSEVEE